VQRIDIAVSNSLLENILAYILVSFVVNIALKIKEKHPSCQRWVL
jgi:hypothetical protein